MNKRFLFLFLAIIVIVSISTRLLPHPPNFAPIAALALFSGVYAAKVSKWFLLLPLIAVFISDLMLGFYDWGVMAAVYGSFAFIGLLGLLLQKRKSVGTVTLAALGGSLLFFLGTNFAVFAFTNYYSPNIEGLLLSYIMALPFLKFTIAGDLFYAAVFFGTYEFALALYRKNALVSEHESTTTTTTTTGSN